MAEAVQFVQMEVEMHVVQAFGQGTQVDPALTYPVWQVNTQTIL